MITVMKDIFYSRDKRKLGYQISKIIMITEIEENCDRRDKRKV